MSTDKCKHCSNPTFNEILTPEIIHHGKQVCEVCGRFHKWIPKPTTEIKSEAMGGKK